MWFLQHAWSQYDLEILRKTRKAAASLFGNRRDSLARSLLAALQPTTAGSATWANSYFRRCDADILLTK